MGCAARVLVVDGDDGMARAARARLEQLEDRWSRFHSASELAQLNASPGVPVVVSTDTFRLVERAVHAWNETGGAFDPTVLDALEAAGYDASFETLPSARPTVGGGGPAPGCGAVALDPQVRAVTLPPGARLDPGGIGKGLAADLVASELVGAGAAGAMVDVGGDVRVHGAGPEAGAWTVLLEDPDRPGAPAASVRLADGGVATSTPRFRQWRMGDTDAHHLIDPASGRPVDTALAGVTVVAGEAWWAEALTKAAFVLDRETARTLIETNHAAALFFDADGSRVETESFARWAA